MKNFFIKNSSLPSQKWKLPETYAEKYWAVWLSIKKKKKKKLSVIFIYLNYYRWINVIHCYSCIHAISWIVYKSKYHIHIHTQFNRSWLLWDLNSRSPDLQPYTLHTQPLRPNWLIIVGTSSLQSTAHNRQRPLYYFRPSMWVLGADWLIHWLYTSSVHVNADWLIHWVYFF